MTATPRPTDPLYRCTVNRRPIREWLADATPADGRALLVRAIKRRGLGPYQHAIAEALDLDAAQVFAVEFPHRAAKAARIAREHGDAETADRIARWLIAGGNCAHCGRPLADPESVNRGVGPDCWARLGPLPEHQPTKPTGATP
jgi:hypothetical protein